MVTAGSAISSVLLIADLGRPSRFLNMLRIFKPQSAMSVGSWVLSGFAASATASTLADIIETQEGGNIISTFLRTAGRAGCTVGLVAAAFETWEGLELLRTHDRELSPTKRGFTGALIQTAGILSGPLPLALRVASLFTKKNKRRLRQAAALSGIIGSLCLRYGWVAAGAVSARDWKTPLGIQDRGQMESAAERIAES